MPIFPGIRTEDHTIDTNYQENVIVSGLGYSPWYKNGKILLMIAGALILLWILFRK